MAEEMTSDGEAPHRRRKALKWLIGAIVVITITNMIGDAIGPGLRKTHPLLLITMNSRKRWLLLTVNNTDAWSWYLVAVGRQLLSDPIYYALGRWYGDAGARWLEKQMGEGGSAIRWLESGFAKASWPMVALFPNHIICMLAGASGMPVLLFYALNIGGTIALMIVFRTVGDVFGEPLAHVTHFIDRYRWHLIALSVALIVVNLLMRKKEGKSQFDEIAELERELSGEAEETRQDLKGPEIS